MTFVDPGLGLGALQKFPIDFKIFQLKCPLQNENGLALSTCSNMKVKACHNMDFSSEYKDLCFGC